MGFTVRMAAVAGATATGIALFAGLLAGVPFGYILLRSLIGGSLFAGFGFGSAMLLERFLPELFEAAGGSGLDISVGEDDDDDLRRSAYAHPEAAADSDTVPAAGQTVAATGTADEGDASDDSGFRPGIDAELVEEVQEQHSADTAADAAAAADPDEIDSGSDAVDVESIDALPDMEGMADAFISAEEPVEGIEQSVDGPENPEQAKEIAQAIRTVLQREKQG
ncbi:hypothetical protein [Spirochaeta africana]|uniref:Uncharacterized protein n=1 Tax=Spirochaeta africana (strain ATCC 700263 / DSM 8902 / Z-7692) TaxID=889378 RepID=H9UKT7_SPIAZ|nr:hypothetical protein [Spirochaeta africana]AFG38130.1 hypothetical protein Spiaf_2082 [Spirochaeta africana DSM 8902]